MYVCFLICARVYISEAWILLRSLLLEQHISYTYAHHVATAITTLLLTISLRKGNFNVFYITKTKTCIAAGRALYAELKSGNGMFIKCARHSSTVLKKAVIAMNIKRSGSVKSRALIRESSVCTRVRLNECMHQTRDPLCRRRSQSNRWYCTNTSLPPSLPPCLLYCNSC